MRVRFFAQMLGLVAVLFVVAGCANTIRGIGQDTANTVDATQAAGRDIGTAAEY